MVRLPNETKQNEAEIAGSVGVQLYAYGGWSDLQDQAQTAAGSVSVRLYAYGG